MDKVCCVCKTKIKPSTKSYGLYHYAEEKLTICHECIVKPEHKKWWGEQMAVVSAG
jgi:hypothetical protein